MAFFRPHPYERLRAFLDSFGPGCFFCRRTAAEKTRLRETINANVFIIGFRRKKKKKHILLNVWTVTLALDLIFAKHFLWDRMV